MTTGWTGTRSREILEDVHDVDAKSIRTTTVISGGVFTQEPSGRTVSMFGTASVAVGATNTILSFLASINPVYYVQRIYLSCSQIGTFLIKINGDIKFKIRMSNTQFFYSLDLATGSAFGIKLEGGDILSIIAENNGNTIGDFDTTAQFMEVV